MSGQTLKPTLKLRSVQTRRTHSLRTPSIDVIELSLFHCLRLFGGTRGKLKVNQIPLHRTSKQTHSHATLRVRVTFYVSGKMSFEVVRLVFRLTLKRVRCLTLRRWSWFEIRRSLFQAKANDPRYIMLHPKGNNTQRNALYYVSYHSI